MRAVILAGGKGVRLAPLTEVIPKPLVPIGGMPIMGIIIEQLREQGFRRVTLAVGYMAELIQAYFQDGRKWGIKIDYSYEPAPRGTAGPLALIDGLDETFLVMNADVLTNIDYQELVRFHKGRGGVATISAYQRQHTVDFGVILIDGDCRVKDYVEKPSSTHLVSMGIYIFEPQVLDFVHGRDYLDFPDLVKILLENGLQVNYFPFPGYWLDIGRHDDYATAATEYAEFRKQS